MQVQYQEVQQVQLQPVQYEPVHYEPVHYEPVRMMTPVCVRETERLRARVCGGGGRRHGEVSLFGARGDYSLRLCKRACVEEGVWVAWSMCTCAKMRRLCLDGVRI